MTAKELEQRSETGRNSGRHRNCTKKLESAAFPPPPPENAEIPAPKPTGALPPRPTAWSLGIALASSWFLAKRRLESKDQPFFTSSKTVKR
jgi:hypothetical protein